MHIIEGLDDWILAMRLARKRHGMTNDDLDWRAGLPDRYWGKVEANLLPDFSGKGTGWRRRPINIENNALYAMEALGLRLCLVPISLADGMCERFKDGNRPRPKTFFKDMMIPYALAEAGSIHDKVNARAGYVSPSSRIHPSCLREMLVPGKPLSKVAYRQINRHMRKHFKAYWPIKAVMENSSPYKIRAGAHRPGLKKKPVAV